MNIEKKISAELVTLSGFNLIFPEYGTRALDIPHYDCDKHMYIVEQFVTKGGNRQITYVSVSNKLVVEVTIGFYHSWTLMDKLRLMIPNANGMKVISTYEWPQTTYYNKAALEKKIEELAADYARVNICMVGGNENDALKAFVSEMISDLFQQDIESQSRANGMEVLKLYCSQMKVCRDYVTSDIH